MDIRPDLRLNDHVVREMTGEGRQAEPRRWLTVGDVAARLGVSVKTVNRWAHEGRLESSQTLGGHHRFSPDYIDRIAAEMGFAD